MWFLDNQELYFVSYLYAFHKSVPEYLPKICLWWFWLNL